VQRAREVSREVEARTGVRHESPQALILRGGEAVWSASHWRVTAEAVESALREHQ
jgi:bacillithiol system protein YtxJ